MQSLAVMVRSTTTTYYGLLPVLALVLMNQLVSTVSAQNDPTGGFPPRVPISLQGVPRGAVAGDATTIYVSSVAGELFLADVKSGNGTLLNRGGNGQSFGDICLDSRIDKTLYGAGRQSGLLYAFTAKGRLVRTYQLAPAATADNLRFISACIQTRYWLVVADAHANAFYRLPLDDVGDLRGKPPPKTSTKYQGERIAFSGDWKPAPVGSLGAISVEWSSLWFGFAFVLNSGTGLLYSFPIDGPAGKPAATKQIVVEGAVTTFVGATKMIFDSANEHILYIVLPGRNAIAVLEIVHADLTRAKYIRCITSVTINGPVGLAEFGEWIYSLNALQVDGSYTLTQQLKHDQKIPASAPSDEPFSAILPSFGPLPKEIIAPGHVADALTADPPVLPYEAIAPIDNTKPAIVSDEDTTDDPETDDETFSAPVFGDNNAVPEVGGSKCFPSSGIVTLEDGSARRMDELVIGDRVLAAFHHVTGAPVYSPVFLFTHRDPLAHSSSHIRITHSASSSTPLTLTASHYMYINGALAAASTAKLGDTVYVAATCSSATIMRVDRGITAWGLYNPQTIDGRIIVDGVVASTYTTAVDPVIASALLAPARWAAGALGKQWDATMSSFDLLTHGAEGLDWVANALPRGRLQFPSAAV
jgi:Hint module